MSKMNEIKTDRLRLRHWKEEDATDLYQIASNPDVAIPSGWPPHESEQQSRELIKTTLAHPKNFAIVIKGSNKVIGSIGVHPTPKIELAEGEVEVGFWIGEPYWNQGYASEALKAMTEALLEDPNVTAVWTYFGEHHPIARRLIKNQGFEVEKAEYISFPLVHESRKCYFARKEIKATQKEGNRLKVGNHNLGYFIGLGLALGTGLGVIMNNIVLGLSIGFVFGLAFGSSKKKDDEDE